VAPTEIPLSVPVLRGNEWQYVKECLDSNWVSSAGPFVDRFERDVAAYVGARYAVALSTGTAALHLALLVAGVEPDDEVLISALTFIAPAYAIRYANAWPIFVDAEPAYWQMDTQRVLDFLEHGCQWQNGALYNRQSGRRVKALLPVHILGHPVDMAPLCDAAEKYGLAVIEDATESLGARYRGQAVGQLGDVACFSFNGNKLITTGGGGMLVTNNEAWARRARYLSTQAKDDPLEYIHGAVGYNYRLTNVQAALGCAQMEQITDYIAAKRAHAAAYQAALAEVPGLTLMREAEWAYSTYWLFNIVIDAAQYGMDSRALLHHLADEGIQTRPLWHPLHRNSIFREAMVLGGAISEQLNREALSLPSSVDLSPEALERVTSQICALAAGT
jgi:perosamine synthetase